MIKRIFAVALASAFVAIPSVFLAGCRSEACSDGTTTGGVALIDTGTASCKEGNACIADKSGAVECRLTCASQNGAADGCPVNYYCTTGSTGAQYCQKTTYPIEEGPGTWGASCIAKKGVSGEDCNTAAGFGCYAESPSAAGICTLYNCAADSDCKGGFFCATVNKNPSADSKARSFGETQKVCIPRDYCAPCEHDIDCPIIDGASQVCARDGAGKRFCTTECTGDKGCKDQATCRPRADQGEADKEGNVCVPRFGTCKGKGDLCDPCRSDADCATGAICTGEAFGNYNTEKFCTRKVADCADCKGLVGKMDDPYLRGNVASFACLSKADASFDFPPNQCFGLVQFGASADANVLGCYTPKKTTDR